MEGQFRLLHDVRDERGAGSWQHCRGCRMNRARGDKAIAYADEWWGCCIRKGRHPAWLHACVFFPCTFVSRF